MAVEIVPYALLALALGAGAAALLVMALLRSQADDGERRPTTAMLGNIEKQVGLAVLLVAIIFLVGLAYLLREPARMASAAQRQTLVATEKGMHTYLQLCVSCHGTHGEGGVGKPLNTSAFREGSPQELDKAADLLRKTISRGRYGTAMPAWAQEDGGPLNAEQINQLVTMIQHGDWAEVARLAAEQPNQTAPAPGTTGAQAADAPHAGVADQAARGKALYSQKGCVACHGPDLQGGVGPNLQHLASKADIVGAVPLNPDNLKQWLNDPGAIKKGTAMPKLGLSDIEIEALVAFLMQQK